MTHSCNPGVNVNKDRRNIRRDLVCKGEKKEKILNRTEKEFRVQFDQIYRQSKDFMEPNLMSSKTSGCSESPVNIGQRLHGDKCILLYAEIYSMYN